MIRHAAAKAVEGGAAKKWTDPSAAHIRQHVTGIARKKTLISVQIPSSIVQSGPRPFQPDLKQIGGLQHRNVSTKPKTNAAPHAKVNHLRRILGLQSPNQKPLDAVFVSLDTESSRNAVVEVGISTLDTASIRDLSPGLHAQDWISQMQHHHLVLKDQGQSKAEVRWRMQRSLFSQSRLVSGQVARKEILRILRDAAGVLSHTGETELAYRDSSPSLPQANLKPIVLVGQSPENDTRALTPRILARLDTGLHLDILNPFITGIHVATIFDTAALAAGAGIPDDKKRLGYLLRYLGVEEKYWEDEVVRGWHCAGNDAAYALMALLMFAIRREELDGL